MRSNRWLPAIGLLALASFARADTLRLVAPAAGVTLRGGSFAEVRWSASQLPPGAEEWEAFLSIDGGKYYGWRVTPHLDIDLQHFTFIVPNVDTRNARILIRAGNEVHEAHFESPATFSIAHDASAGESVPRLLQSGRGEAAREGDAPVISWADGARNGAGITQHVSMPIPIRSLHRTTRAGNDSVPALAPAPLSISAPLIAIAELPARAKHARAEAALPLSVDLLLVCSRRNV